MTSSLELFPLPELADLPVGVGGTGPSVHLTVAPDPLVGDPLGAHQDGAASVLHEDVVASVLVHVPPEDDTSFLRPDEGPDEREDGVSSSRDVGEISHDGGQSVPGVHVEHVPGLQAARLGPHEDLVVVRDVLTGQPVVGHLVQFGVLSRGGVQVEEVVNPVRDVESCGLVIDNV